MFFVAGRFGFNIFDRRIDLALEKATAQLRTEFTQMLEKEARELREDNQAQLTVLEDGLTKRITQQNQDLTDRSDFQFQCAQGITTGIIGRLAQARDNFRAALGIYKAGKPRQLIGKSYGAITVANILGSFEQEDKANFEENAKKELANPLYNNLADELALVGLEMPHLALLLKERKPSG